jgi:hypothetical protein
MKLSRPHVIFYLAWLGAFALVELPAAVNAARGDTLSEMVWVFMDWHIVPAILVSGFMVWLAKHFIGRLFVRGK